jgi:transposase-like protein
MDPTRQFCSNPECPLMSKIGGGHIRIHSQQEKRYVCRECGVTFSETKDTPYYRLHHSKQIVTWALILLAYGCPPMAIVHAFGIDERTVLSWQKRGGAHCRKIQEAEVEAGKIDLEHVQADELYVKTVKPGADEETDGSESEDAGSAGSAGGSSRSGRVWMAMAICVPSRLWLGGVVSERRDQALIDQLVGRVRRAASSLAVLVCVDGLPSYVGGFKKAFRVPVRTGKAGRPRLVLAEGFLLGQVVKQYQGRRVASVSQRAVVGTLEAIRAVIRATRGMYARRKGGQRGGGQRGGDALSSEGLSPEDEGGQINTSYIERLNATFRSCMALLTRRGRSIAHQIALVSAGMYLVGGLYNFCTPHDSLREPAAPGERSKTGVAIRWNERTPAMAAGLTDHLWTPLELFSYRVPPPRPAPKKRRGRPPGTASHLPVVSHA